MALHIDLEIHKVAEELLGLLRQASHSQKDRAALANLVLRRGHTVNGDLTKTYPNRRGAPCKQQPLSAGKHRQT